MIKLFRKIKSLIFTFISLYNINHGDNCICNNYCKFTQNTIIGKNCHFNGMKISGKGLVKIGNNFHSGSKIRIINTYHNFKSSTKLPYDETTYSKDVIIGENVWLGEDVLILGGVTIGDGAIIQAGSVVSISVPSLAIAGGNPAKAFNFRDKKHYDSLIDKEKRDENEQ